MHDPLKLFEDIYRKALAQGELSPDAMSLATVDAKGQPSVRIVLYKGISKKGFVFYTNYTSRKAQELSNNPRAALAFYWPKLYEQVRVEGVVSPLTKEESLAYFETRSYDNQISAWASEQSKEIMNREYLLDRYARYKEKFKTRVDYPNFWGGYRLIPNQIEFWLGADRRLHNRVLYRAVGNSWEKVLLAP